MSNIAKSQLLTILVGVFCVSCEENTTWQSDVCRIEGKLELTPFPGRQTPIWTACRAVYVTGMEDYDIPPVMHLQLMTPGSRGSVVEPGKGWLTLTFHGQQRAGSLTVPRDALAPPGALGVNYNGFDGDYANFNVGSASLSKIELRPLGDGNPDSRFSISGQLAVSARAATGEEVSVSGSLGFGTAVQSSSGSTSLGGGGAAGTGSSGTFAQCDGYKNQCDGGLSMAVCYCAAACVFHYAGQSGNEGNYRSMAANLGTTCRY